MSGHFLRSTLVATATVAAAIAAIAFTAGTDFIDFDPQTPDSRTNSVLEGCATCHGRDGRSVDSLVPRLRAQNEDYLVNQLKWFAQLAPGSSARGAADPFSPIVRGQEAIRMRRSQVMQEHTAGLDDALVAGLARYYSRLPCEVEIAAAPAAPMPQGTAWCNDCHAPKKVKDFSNVPSLNGQSADYLEAQLQAFRQSALEPPDGQDNARAHHFMNRSVRTFSDRRIRELAEYFAAQACFN